MQAASPGTYGNNATTGESPVAGPGSASASPYSKSVNGGRFDFDDGGTYCGGWEDGKAHGHGVCTGPKGQGEYSGSWHYGFEVSGIYTWPSGSTFEGQWQNGKRHGLGVEYRGRWTYRGEWTQGFKGRYGVRQATASNAKYEGTWANGLQDGYGSETYADGGTYQGQWLRGLRHGYGVRTSAPFGMASHFRPKAQQGSMASLKSESLPEPTAERDKRMDDVRGGFVLRARSDDIPLRRRSLVERSSNIKDSLLKGLKLRKQRSTGDLDKRGTSSSIRSTGSSTSWVSNESAVTSGSHHTDSNASFIVEDDQMDASVTETYMGEWKNDKRSGFGISERSDGLKYEGEWYNNKKYGYGVTTFRDGTKEEGKYKNNVLITSQKKKHLFLIRSAKFRERIDAAVNAAQRASKIALQKADIAISRTATARGKAEQADGSALQGREDSEIARVIAKQFAPDFFQPGTEIQRHHRLPQIQQPDLSKLTMPSSVSTNNSSLRTNEKTQGLTESSTMDQLKLDHSQAHINASMSNLSSYHVKPPSIPDRLDRSSMSNQPITPPSLFGSKPLVPKSPPSLQTTQETSRTQEQLPPPQPNLPQPQSLSSYTFDQMSTSASDGEIAHSRVPLPSGKSSQQDLSSSSFMPSASRRQNYAAMDSGPHSHSFDAPTAPMQNQEPLPMSSDMRGPPPPRMERGRDHTKRSQMNSQQPRSISSHPSSNPYAYSFQQAMSDHFEHYNRPPSRDSSIDRYGRARSRTRGFTPERVANAYSRPVSRQRTPTLESIAARGSNSALEAALENINFGRRGETPSRFSGRDSPGIIQEVTNTLGSTALEDVVLRQRGGLGQEIPSAPYAPKRTESMFLKPATQKPPPVIDNAKPMPKQRGVSIERKKSLPDAVSLPRETSGIPREELAALGSAMRQEIHRQREEAERYKANPFLYLLNPNVKNWFSRQKLVVIVLVINLSLAFAFLQLLS